MNSIVFLVAFTALILRNHHVICTKPNFEILNSWKNMEFGFDSEAQKEYAIKNGLFVPSILKRPSDSDIYIDESNNWHRFICVPRLSAGIPYTLGVINKKSRLTKNGMQLQAYPNVTVHLNRKCNEIFGIFRIWVQQSCHLLWVIDSGVDYFDPKLQVCPPKIMAFDLRTNQIKYVYKIPPSQYVASTVFNAIIVVDGKTCQDSQIYVTDPRGFGLLVYNLKRNESWRVYSKHFKIDFSYSNVTIKGESFDYVDGIYTVAPVASMKRLYFHPFSSVTEYSVPLFLVNSKRIWRFGWNLDFLFNTEGQRSSQSATMAVDSRGRIYFSLIDQLAIKCWNPNTIYSEENFGTVLQNDDLLQFVTGLKVRSLPGIGEVLIGTSNRLQRHDTRTIVPEEINYYVFMVKIENYDCS